MPSSLPQQYKLKFCDSGVTNNSCQSSDTSDNNNNNFDVNFLKHEDGFCIKNHTVNRSSFLNMNDEGHPMVNNVRNTCTRYTYNNANNGNGFPLLQVLNTKKYCYIDTSTQNLMCTRDKPDDATSVHVSANDGSSLSSFEDLRSPPNSTNINMGNSTNSTNMGKGSSTLPTAHQHVQRSINMDNDTLNMGNGTTNDNLYKTTMGNHCRVDITCMSNPMQST